MMPCYSLPQILVVLGRCSGNFGRMDPAAARGHHRRVGPTGAAGSETAAGPVKPARAHAAGQVPGGEHSPAARCDAVAALDAGHFRHHWHAALLRQVGCVTHLPCAWHPTNSLPLPHELMRLLRSLAERCEMLLQLLLLLNKTI